MFTSILDTTTGSLSLQSALICIIAAIVLGLVLACIYMKTSPQHTKGFIVTLAILPVLVETVILMTSGSLGGAIAVAGTFSLVRFRSAPGTSKEILAVFFSMAIGLACGMGQIAFATLITVVVSVLFVVLMSSAFGGNDRAKKNLRITIPEDLDYNSIFDDVFDKYTRTVQLNRVKTMNLGSMYELDYDIELKDEAKEKKMIDELRIRNGNLSIICGRKAENTNAL